MSLRLRLVITLGLTLMLVWAVTATWSMRDLSAQIERSLDQRLAQSARMVAGLLDRVPASVWSDPERSTETIPSLAGVACRISSMRGQVVAGTHPEMDDVLATSEAGYSVRLHDGQHWRIYTLIDGERRITVADRLRERDALLEKVLRAALYPFLVALAGSLVVLWWGVSRGLVPLSRLQQRLAKRDHDDLSPLPERRIPGEIRPLIISFNGLLGRVRRMLELEQRFTDDAAHELRTPLTAIRTHLQVAGRVDGAPRQTAMRHAEDGVVRLSRTLDQLLLLARMEGGTASDDDSRPANLSAALTAAMADTESGEFCRWPDEAPLLALCLPESLLTTALRNLLENARRHGEPQGPIDIHWFQDNGTGVIEIANPGEPIPPERLLRLTERFHRGNHPRGSGLGLSIVEAIVTRFGGQMTLHAEAGTALRVTLRLPLAK